MEKSNPKQWSTMELILWMVVLCLTQFAIYTLYSQYGTRVINSNPVHINNSRSRSLLSYNDTLDEYNYEFGHDAKRHFVLDPSYTEFQWGSYGNSPTDVIEYQYQVRLQIEYCPTCWMKYKRDEQLLALLQRLSNYMNIKDYHDLVFTLNAHTGINVALKSMARACSYHNKPCKVLKFNTAFSTIDNVIQYINNDPSSNVAHFEVVEFNLNREMLQNTDLLISNLKSILMENDIFLATISHIPSLPNTVFDIKRLCELFRKYNVISFIDGAFSLGQLNINITDINPDIFITNGHKWFFSTRGSSLMYIKKEVQHLIEPSIISNRYKYNSVHNNNVTMSMQDKFNWQGTMDDSIWLSFNAGLDFRNKFGDENIIQYVHDLAIAGGNSICKIWNTSLLVYNEQYIGAMINPILPNIYGINFNQTIADILMDRLYVEYNTIVYIKEFDGFWYMRLMVAIYHELSDFEWIAYKTLDILHCLSN